MRKFARMQSPIRKYADVTASKVFIQNLLSYFIHSVYTTHSCRCHSHRRRHGMQIYFACLHVRTSNLVVCLVRDAYESVFIFDFMYGNKYNAPFKWPSAYTRTQTHTCALCIWWPREMKILNKFFVSVSSSVYDSLWQQKNATNGFMFNDHGLCGWKFTWVQHLFRSPACRFSFSFFCHLTKMKNLIWFMTGWLARWHDPSNTRQTESFQTMIR